MVGEAVANIAANDAARKDVVDAQYRAEEKALTQQQIALQQQRGQNIANAAGQVSSALGSAAMSYAGTYMGAGSPGGGGVVSTKDALKQMGGDNATWLKNSQNSIKAVNSLNDNFDILKTQLQKNPHYWDQFDIS